jgi:hypothetical protein
MIKTRLALVPVLASFALAISGCGGGGGSSDLATFAPPGSLVFVEGSVRPTGELKSDVDAIAKKVAGVDNLGDLIVSKLEGSARDEGEPFDFAKEVEPWLGEEGALVWSAEDVDSNNPEIVLESIDAGATQRFIDAQVESSPSPYRHLSYKGIDYVFGGKKHDTAVGVVGGFLLDAGSERSFEEAVDAFQGASLGDENRFQEAFSAAADGSLADAYVDVGGVIERSQKKMSPEARVFLESARIDIKEATAVASLVPGSDQVEIDLSSDLGGEQPPSGDASKLLGSLPADSFAALASASFGDRVMEAIDRIDASGVPGKIPPHKLKSGLKERGIDLEAIFGSLHDAAVFGIGSDRSSLGGAAMFVTDDPTRASNTVSNIGLLLSASGTPGVTPLSGGATGFSIRSAGLGSKPLVIAAEGDRIVIAYGLPANLSASSRTLADNPDYAAAAASLGDTPIAGFVDGPATLRLVESLVPRSEEGFQKAKPYLANIRFVALGSETDGDLAKAKLIVGLAK